MKRALTLTCWLPLATLVGIEMYIRSFDGWGAWATAPLLLLPLVAAIVVGGIGVVQCVGEARGGGLKISSIALTALAFLPALWLLFRRQLF